MLEFFDDAEIFITGGSGVVGKAFIEKLLRSGNPKRLYLLLRPKKNRAVQERIAALKKEKIFTRVLREKPDCFDKIVAIAGDVLLPKLGISPEDLERLQNVTLFYHSAATVRFNEPLKLALTLNVGGTHEALLLAEKLKKLKLFMYVSTYFSNPYLEHVEEKVYPTPMNWRFAVERLKEDVDENVLEILSKKITIGFPNTYCFTKNLSESMVNDFRHRVQVVIYRPSIVVQALREPEPGFPSTTMGPLGLFALTGAGLLKGLYVGKENRLDMTPLDICAKTMLYYTIKAKRFYDEVGIPPEAPVYQVASDKYVPMSFTDMNNMTMEQDLWWKCAYEKSLLIPGILFTDSYFLYMATVFLKQLPAAIFADLLLRLFRMEPQVMKIARTGFVMLKVMDPFRTNNYTSNGITLLDEMLRDTENTPLSIQPEFDRIQSYEGMAETAKHMFDGIRKYLLNESPDTLERSQRILTMKIFGYNILRGVFYGNLVTWLYGKYIN